MKIFEVSTASFSNADNNSVGGREANRNGQGTIYIPTGKKSEAMAVLASFGYFRVNPIDCRLSMGNDINAITQAGVMTEGSLVFVSLDKKRVGKAYFEKGGARISKAVGRFEMDSKFKRTFIAS